MMKARSGSERPVAAVHTNPSPFVVRMSSISRQINNDDEDDEDSGRPIPLPPLEDVLPGTESSDSYDEQDLQKLTVSQLKQQLRLRGQRVTGRKSDLLNRLLLLNTNGGMYSPTTDDAARIEDEDETTLQSSQPNSTNKKSSEARQFAAKQGKELIDVTAYLDADDVGKYTRSSARNDNNNNMDEVDLTDETSSTFNSEVWGADARILDDVDSGTDSSNGDTDDNKRPLVIDSLSRTLLEFKGSNQTYVPAVVIATRDALRPFLSGGSNSNNCTLTIAQATEQRLREIQLQREKASTVPVHFDDTDGLDEGDETGVFANVLHREVSDWGKYSVTGAQLSAQEVAGVLLLSDVYGAFNADTTALAEKIAFECQPVIVMIPDLFRGNPWSGPLNGTNDKGQSYEVWRASHDDLRVRIDVRAAACCMRDTYGVSSVVVWGTCYGGGRALEAAATLSHCDDAFLHDVDGVTIGPPPVDPAVVVAWYPTRYNARELFGIQPSHFHTPSHKVAVMGVFAGNDQSPGATAEDAATLKQLLDSDTSVVDHMIKVFPEQEHGFAHLGLSQPQQPTDFEKFIDEEFGGAGRLTSADGDAEVACLLSTAFMETYSRVFLPTVGPPISSDEPDNSWGRELTIKDLKATRHRDVRGELKDAIDNFVEEPLMSGPRVDPTDDSQEESLAKLLRSMQDPDTDGPYKISDDDDLPTIYKKLLSADNNFQIF